jgi:2-polyprenyl-3-methyl-5-hydroxy-6-metoxy-1,4-benzoquinol methylase
VDREQWDERYSGEELVWTSTPNQFLVSEVADLPAGSAVDLACGEGRNAVWLAERGWMVTGVDFSSVVLAKAQRLAESRQVDVRWVESAVDEWRAPSEGFDLVAVFYLQLPHPQRSVALTAAAASVAPGGMLLVVAHDHDNLTRGFGGPQEDAVLYSVGDVAEEAKLNGLIVERAEQIIRHVVTESGNRQAIDTLVRAVRPT